MKPVGLGEPAPDPSEKILLRGGVVYDGTGSPPLAASVAVAGGRVIGIGRFDTDGWQVVDVDGLAIAPGIVDMHTHSDVSVLSHPACVSAIGQGITTQVVGHCGFSAAPTDARTRRTLVEEEPVFGFPHPEESGLWGWDDVDGYLAAVEESMPATNIATLTGHNTIRRLVLGSEERGPTPDELDLMAKHVSEGLLEGAVGFSTGLSYAPGMYADTHELAVLARQAGTFGRRYHTHMRYGDLTTRESLLEAIETARVADVALNVSHLYPGRKDPHDEAGRLLDLIEGAARDTEVTFDLTLFRRGGGAWLQGLPGWARAGGLEATRARISDPGDRRRMLDAVGSRDDWDDQLVVKVNSPRNSHLVGRSIGEIARERGKDPASTALELVTEDGQFWIAPTIKRQEDLDLLLAHPACVPVTDGMAADPVAHASLGLMPKTFGTFALLFGDYVRRRRVLTLTEAIRRVTSLAADRVGLDDRGTLVAGKAADIIVFDPEEIDNRATDHRPGQRPAGIRHVIVNGRFAMFDGQFTGDRAGRALR